MKIRATLGLAAIGASVLLFTGCAANLPGGHPRADSLAWAPFRWVGANVGGRTFDKAAILVPFAADTLGGTFWLQLDTGADAGVWLYTAPLDQLLRRQGPPRDTTRRFELRTGQIGAYPLRNQAVNIRRVAGDTVRADDPAPKIGTLGLNFFRDKILLLDFPGQRFAILDTVSPLPRAIQQRASWVPIDYRDDKMFIPLTLAGKTYDDFFYDSGASLFPVSTTPEIWQQVTGRTGAEPDNTVWKVRSFGQDVVLVGAPVHGRASVGAATLEQPMVFHMTEGPEQLDLRNWEFRASGLVGNVLFANRYLVIIDLHRRRLGLVAQQR